MNSSQKEVDGGDDGMRRAHGVARSQEGGGGLRGTGTSVEEPVGVQWTSVTRKLSCFGSHIRAYSTVRARARV